MLLFFTSTSAPLHRSACIQLLLILVSLVQISVTLDPSGSVSIDQLPAWSSQRQCGRGCLQNNFDGGPDLESVLGCTWNGCYCGTQYQAIATSYITSCLTEFCGNSAAVTYDISTAMSIYDAYCGIAVAAATSPGSVPATTTTANNNAVTPGSSNNQLPTQISNGNSGAATSGPSATASPTSSSSSLSLGGIIGVAVSVGTSVIGLCVTIWFKYLRHRLEVRRDKRQEMQQRGWY